jgi:prepilin-type processing-associated H-X9-DG protein
LDEYEKVTDASGGFARLSRIETGAFGSGGSKLPISAITDGTSNTIALTEKKIGSGALIFDLQRDWIDGITLSGGTTADDWMNRCNNIKSANLFQTDSGRAWILYGSRYSAIFTSVPPNSSTPDCGNVHDNGEGVFVARSYHPGGVNATMADGSVRWVKNGINVSVWRALGTRNGGETVGEY